MARPIPRVPPVTIATLPPSDSINPILREPLIRDACEGCGSVNTRLVAVRIKAEMPPSFSVSPMREILEGRLSKLLPDLESELDTFVSERCLRARRELADELNQAARRMQQAPHAAAIAATLVEAVAAFSAGVALFRIDGSGLRGEQIRGVSEPCAEGFRKMAMSLEVAPALAEAVRTHDPVTAIAAAGEISGELVSLLGRGPQERVYVYPVTAAGRVRAVLCAWGDVDGAVLELLAQIAGARWQALPTPSGMVQMTLPETSQNAAPPAVSAWDALSAEEQRIHLRAQRRARVEIAEMRLYAVEAVESGRAQKDLYAALRPRIDAARQSFHKQYFSATTTMVDYLHLELLRTLAHDDPDLLGKDYPGPLA
jgi:hypothetical protein